MGDVVDQTKKKNKNNINNSVKFDVPGLSTGQLFEIYILYTFYIFRYVQNCMGSPSRFCFSSRGGAQDFFFYVFSARCFQLISYRTDPVIRTVS